MFFYFILNNNHKYGFFQDFKYVNPLSSKNKLTISEQKELLSLNSKKTLRIKHFRFGYYF